MIAPAELERDRVLAHYVPMHAQATDPTALRLTVEVYSLDPGTDLATCYFAMEARMGGRPPKRHVRKLVDGHAQVVGLWRIVPEASAPNG
ncbi:MAG: hypothetical protein JWO85_2126 [Candidatus Eremiobacteraeota bacterium]|nr:hypothetical protein [Candidatus Eremiobacteraeota bacterium]